MRSVVYREEVNPPVSSATFEFTLKEMEEIAKVYTRDGIAAQCLTPFLQRLRQIVREGV